MHKKTLCILWGALFILCAGLGFIQERQGIMNLFLLLCSLCFFVPPALLVLKAAKEGDEPFLRLIRNLSALSLLFTLILIVLNILSARWPAAAGNFLNTLLILVSSPMFCCGNWFLSMFLWAFLMIVSIRAMKK